MESDQSNVGSVGSTSLGSPSITGLE